MSSNPSTECQYLQDMYGNYQPSTVQFDLTTDYTIDISSHTRPSFIVKEKFGITDTTVYIKRQSVSGSLTTLSINKRLRDTNLSQSVKDTHYDSHNITVTSTTYTLANGQAMCLEYETKGGGYLKAKDTRTHIVLSAKPYTKTVEQQRICYRYDSQPPEHCSNQSTCSSEPLQLDKRITRSNLHHIEFNGWADPVPPGGASRTASSIESYEIRVNEVLPSKGSLQVDYTTNVLSRKVDHTVKSMDLNLTSDGPRLYCLTLEVKDVADNVRQCRRFVLYDNTSSIQIWNEKHFRFTSASPDTDYTRQTHHNDVCLSWKDYFYNDFYIHNELLNPIESDPYGLITGSCEQTTGQIPVSGTSNVYGIIAYDVSWSLNHGSFSGEIPVSSFTNQSFCRNMNVNDGDTYTVSVKAIDIFGNALSDNRTVFIDRSAPHLNNIWIEKDGYERLYVHNSTDLSKHYSADLSKIKMTFDALDRHSGVYEAAWIFGITKADTVLLSRGIGIQTVSSEMCDIDNEQDYTCYCPQIAIGHCEVFKYVVDLARYMTAYNIIGVQSEEYFFNISVKNTAGLISEKRITTVLDETPPEVGNVSIEYSQLNDSNSTFERHIVVHWQDFSDAESGIRSYRIGINTRCLTKEEMASFSRTTESPLYIELSFKDTSTEIFDNTTCASYITVIAINNALLPSSAVCIEVLTKPCENSFAPNEHDEDSMVLRVSLSTSGAIVVALGMVVVVAYLVIKRRRSRAEARQECRVSHHKGTVSFQCTADGNNDDQSPYNDLGKVFEENPYQSISDDMEGERTSAVDNPIYTNLQLTLT